MPEEEKQGILQDPRFWYCSAVVWLIVAIIGFILLFLYSTPPQLIGLAEILSIVGILSTWYSIITGGATLRQQGVMLKQHEDMLRRQDESLSLLRKILQALERIEKRLVGGQYPPTAAPRRLPERVRLSVCGNELAP